MNVILSIKPKYANEIIQGRKKIEFRKNLFKREIEKVYIYSSSPVKKIVGYFTIEDIVIGSPQYLWKKYNKVGCIDRFDFFAYYEGKENAIGINIAKVVKLKKEFDPYTEFENFKAPQSYMYIEKIIE